MSPPEPDSIPDAVDELVFQALERLEEEGPEGLERFLEASPKHAAEIRQRFDALRASGLVEGLDQPALNLPSEIGTYSIEGLIGEGGMGLVVAATDHVLERPVALKIVRPELLAEPGTRDRFQREVHAVAQLRHSGIVRVYEVGESNDLPYLAMERIDGCSLADALETLVGRSPSTLHGGDLLEAITATGPSRLEEEESSPLFRGTWPQTCAHVIREVAEALHHAHEAGVLHRDIKPSNIMLTPHGRVVLLDFGLATVSEAHTLTRTGSLVGSLPYTAPERISADRPASVRGDVYALGLVLYELLTLQLPFRAGSRSGLIEAIVGSTPQVISKRNQTVPWSIAAVTRRAMDRKPELRHSSAALLAADMTNALAGRALDEERVTLLATLRGWLRRRPFEAALSVSAALLVLSIPIVILGIRAEAAASTTASARHSIERLSTTLGALDELRRALRPLDELKGTKQENFQRNTLAKLRPLYLGIVTESHDRQTGFEAVDAAARISLAETLLALGRGDEVPAILDSASLRSALTTELQARLALVLAELATSPSAARAILDRASSRLARPVDPWLKTQLEIARALLPGAGDDERAAAADAARAAALEELGIHERATLAAAKLEAQWSAPTDEGEARLAAAAGELRALEPDTSDPLAVLSMLGRVLERRARLERRRGDSARAAETLTEAIEIHARIDGALTATDREDQRTRTLVALRDLWLGGAEETR